MAQTDKSTAATFGFETVAPEDRQGKVNRVFSSVANRYDAMNDLMSGGLHRIWKDDMISWLSPPRGEQPFHLLDAAGGTGDVTLRFIKAAGPNALATIVDISPQMLEVGRKRVAQAQVTDRVALIEGNAEALPFANRDFDAYTIAFGIRNVTEIEKALSEAFRVLKFGGRFLCMEFSQMQVPLIDRLYDFHSFEVIPRLGQMMTGDREAYQYLVESIRRFPDQDTFAGLIREAGFERVSYRNLAGGIAAIHSGWKL